jgi:superfamily II DNA/RNA helicase
MTMSEITFLDFSLDNDLMEGLYSMGYKNPTPIQQQAIPIILSGNDIIGCAQTGTGKTAAYLLPVMHKIITGEHKHLNTLIIAPTRELALQIDQQVEGLAYFTGISSIPIYGGGDGMTWDQQRKALEQGANIVIATPGRLISLLAGDKMDLSHLQHLILDEADRMLDMGFYDDIVKIINYLPVERQTLLFSATMPPKIKVLAGKILKNPKEVAISISKPAEGILQQSYMTYDTQKVDLLRNILKEGEYKSVIIFASTKENVKKLDITLKRTVACKAFHSDLEQDEREQIMREFKSGKLQVLIGTDVLSRGIDVEGIDLVVNFDVPPDPEDYIHRIGRTARAASKGTAITFINEKDQRRFHQIETLMGRLVDKLPLPAFLGEGPQYQPLVKVPFSGDRSKGGSYKKKSKYKGKKPKHNGGGEKPGPKSGE